MPANPKTHWSILFCEALIRIASRIVPADRRLSWQNLWLTNVWHQWRLLRFDAWNARSALKLIQTAASAIPDALSESVPWDSIRSRIRAFARSPWTLLGALLGVFFLLCSATSGLPATRQILRSTSSDSDLVFIWLHPVIGGSDRGLPADVVPGWKAYSQLLTGAAPFNISKAHVELASPLRASPLVIETEPSFFQVLSARPALGVFPVGPEVVLDHKTWASVFHSEQSLSRLHVRIDGRSYPVAAVLPDAFSFLTRRPTVYLVHHRMPDARVMVVARGKSTRLPRSALGRELNAIAQNTSYYFFGSQLRIAQLDATLLAPLDSFALAVVIAAVMLIMMGRMRLDHVRTAWRSENTSATVRRAAFFSTKLILASLLIFTAGVEWSRSESAVMFASRDPGAGPVLVWLYILAAMGAFFCVLIDQRLRCRVCLRVMSFPVRIGCPGCLLLQWSGTELLCTHGHGILQVPYLAPSWAEEAERWIALDESWRGLFIGAK